MKQDKENSRREAGKKEHGKKWKDHEINKSQGLTKSSGLKYPGINMINYLTSITLQATFIIHPVPPGVEVWKQQAQKIKIKHILQASISTIVFPRHCEKSKISESVHRNEDKITNKIIKY